MARPDFTSTSSFVVGNKRVKRAAKPSKVKFEFRSDAERSKRAEQWLDENRDAIESWNSWVEANGLPLARYRASPR